MGRVKFCYKFKDGESFELSVGLDNMDAFSKKDFLSALIEGRLNNKNMMFENRFMKNHADIESVEIKFIGF